MNPSLDLSLSLTRPSYVPKSISNLFVDLSEIDIESDKLSVLSAYICKHQEELSKIEALKPELLQCRLLLMDAIETLKEEFMNIRQNTESQPLVEYLPRKRKSSNELEQREICETYSHAKNERPLVLDNFQPPNLKEIQPCKNRDMEGLPLPHKESSSDSLGSSSGGKGKEVAMDHQLSRNQGLLYLNYHPKPLTQPIWKNNRRRWSSELHARFVWALNILGGIQVATPKQIRDLMQVEGLTIDQVQSHLQTVLRPLKHDAEFQHQDSGCYTCSFKLYDEAILLGLEGECGD